MEIGSSEELEWMKREEDREKRMRADRWAEVKRYYRYCVEHTTEANARNYTRVRFGLSFDGLSKLVSEVADEDKGLKGDGA